MALLVIVLIFVATTSIAQATTFEQVGTFAGSVGAPANPGEFAEEVQLGGVGGMAVNRSGAGGVAPGTVYAVAKGSVGDAVEVARYTPVSSGGDTKLAFREAWEVTFAEGPYGHCGPDAPGEPACEARPDGIPASADIDVDQTTGNVYVLSTQFLNAGQKAVRVYSADGSKLIVRFGEMAAFGETTASSPGKIHASPFPGGIAVDDAGAVYVFDINSPNNFYHRLMVFEPQSPGDYEHYVYSGTANDIGAGFFGEGRYPTAPAVDSAGNLYTAPEETFIQKYEPSVQRKTPVCSFELKTGGITAMTVNPDSGEPFFYTYKDKKVHRLGACKEGKFSEVPPTITVAPERGDLYALALDPDRQFEAGRVPGILYGATPNNLPQKGKGQPDGAALGYVFAPVRELIPKIEAQAVSHVSNGSAELSASINPEGSETSYAFQYLSEAAYEEAGESFAGATEVPSGGTVLGAGSEPLAAGVTLTGLSPDTEYRWRVVATSHCSSAEPAKVCESQGAAQGFRTFPIEAVGLPDGRAYEMVSPVQKHGAQVYPADPSVNSCGSFSECKPGRTYQHFPMQSSPDGEAMVYEGSDFSGGEGATIENQYLARRTATGWQSANLTPPLLLSKAAKGYKVFNRDLSEGLLEQTDPELSPAAPPAFTNLYLQPSGAPASLTPLLSEDPFNFRFPLNRTSGTGDNHFATTYAGASEDLSRVFFEANDALSEETPFAPEALDGGEKLNNLYEWHEGQLSLVNVAPDNAATAPGAMFGSGTLLKSGNQNIPSAVVAHAISTDGSRAFWSDASGQVFLREDSERTIEIPDHAGKFLTASAEGSKVLLSDGVLYDLEAKASTDLTEGKGGFLGVAGQSEDLSRLYFIDTAVLDETPNGQGASAEAGKDNLYAWSEGTTTFVATLAATDNQEVGVWQAAPSVRMAEASPDGRFLAFLSEAQLTGYDNVGPCKVVSGTDEFLPGPCKEVFLYDSTEGQLRCPSCKPSDERPLGPSILRLFLNVKGSLPQSRYLTNEGRLYFDTQDSLVPADTNEGVEDVYQYEPDEVGSCKREGGCVSLISAGHEAVDSNFVAIDEDGGSVFFTTQDKLSVKDSDELFDLYVAREGGGIAAESEAPGGECQGEACQAPVSAPNDPTPASASFNGAGNAEERKSAKHKHKKKHHKKKRKHAKKKSHGRAAGHNRGGAK
ncbi:MAG TPA: hypothetical protein VF245_08935 [Solirubrobacterales bacterium]